MIPTLEDLARLGAISDLDASLARALGRLGGESDPGVMLAAALASRHTQAGHVCLDLSRLPPLEGVEWPEPGPWLEALRASALVGEHAPLVLDAQGRLYLGRYFGYEERLASSLASRASAIDEPEDASLLADGLDRMFGRSTRIDWQRVGAVTALLRRLCVISGGPGTGKTSTVIRILVLLVEQALRASRPVPHVTLLAPTGKAAARLVETIRRARPGLACSDEVREHIPEQASTIHRGLGTLRSSTRFRHDADDPLPADVVIVDEASMVDLGLMTRLVDAVRPEAKLILLGDRDQLASVEAGAVLGDICNADDPRGRSAAFASLLSDLSGQDVPASPSPPAGTGIWDCVVQLERSYRFDASSGIGALCRAINAGDSEAALEVLASPDFPDVELASGGPADELILSGFGPGLEAPDPAGRLEALDRFRILCAHRRGPGGVETLNPLVERRLASAGLLSPTSRWYPGRPVLVTRNDYALRLFNGDTGVVIADPGTGRPRAAFLSPDGSLRTISPSRLPPHETAFAMSIHKAQGSEFDAVAVVLPQVDSPLLTRELMYTAVSRATTRVVIHGDPRIVARAVERRIDRGSGLGQRLWGSVL
jgi:exodeoxyribonuclease V alpha subunit